MDEYLVKINKLIVNTLIQQNCFNSSKISDESLITNSNNDNFLEFLIKERLIDNEFIIDTVAKAYPQMVITDVMPRSIVNYASLKEYVKNGYFVFKEQNANCIAINNLSQLNQVFNTSGFEKVTLIRKSNFLSILYREFNHLSVSKSKYLLDFKNPSFTAKNVDYIKTVLGFCIIFFTSFIGFISTFYTITR